MLYKNRTHRVGMAPWPKHNSLVLFSILVTFTPYRFKKLFATIPLCEVPQSDTFFILISIYYGKLEKSILERFKKVKNFFSFSEYRLLGVEFDRIFWTLGQ